MKRKIDHIDLYRHLTQQELWDYSKGVLGNEEMYRLELHLNECELCSDALEGMGQVNQPDEILRSINEKIVPAGESFVWPRKYMAIAASVLLVAAIGFTFWMLNPLNNERSLAVNSKLEEQKAGSAAQPENEIGPLSDTLSNAQNVAAVPDEEELDEIIISDVNQKPVTTAPATKPTQLGLAEHEPEVKIKRDTEPQIPVDQVEAAGKGIQGEAEIAENFAADETDKDIAAPTAAAQERMVSSQTQRAKKATTQPSSESGPVTNRNEAEPVGGNDAYKTYLKDKLVYPQQALDNNTKGTVVLEITIAPNGAISDIRVIKSVGDGCDEEAKRLVLTGPQWLPAVVEGNPIETKTEIKVRFRP